MTKITRFDSKPAAVLSMDSDTGHNATRYARCHVKDAADRVSQWSNEEDGVARELEATVLSCSTAAL